MEENIKLSLKKVLVMYDVGSRPCLEVTAEVLRLIGLKFRLFHPKQDGCHYFTPFKSHMKRLHK